MEFVIRKTVTIIEETRSESGRIADKPLRKVAVAAVIQNPYSGNYQDDLSEAVKWSVHLGQLLGDKAVEALKDLPESYGKGGVVGINGELDHANMFLTTSFGDAFRKAIGDGKAWIPSSSKKGGPGTALDIPLAHKDALYVRSHYDAMEVGVSDAPLPDEVVVIVVVANRGRLNYRLGGLRKENIRGEDGLR
jgi:Amino acid synthesis